MATLTIGSLTNAGSTTIAAYLGSPAGNLQEYDPTNGSTTVTELQGVTTLTNSGTLNLREDLLVGTLTLTDGTVDLYGTDRFLSCSGTATVSGTAKITHSHTDDTQRPYGYITASNYSDLASLQGVITSSDLTASDYNGHGVVYGEFGAYVNDAAISANGNTGGIIWTQNGENKHVIIEAYIPSGTDGITRQEGDVWKISSLAGTTDTNGEDSGNAYSGLGSEQTTVYYRIFDGVKFHYATALYVSATGTWYITTDANSGTGSLRWVLANAGNGATVIYDVRRNTGVGDDAMNGSITLTEALATALTFQFGTASGGYFDADGNMVKSADGVLSITDGTDDNSGVFQLDGASVTAYQSLNFDNLEVSKTSAVAIAENDASDSVKIGLKKVKVDEEVKFDLSDIYSTSSTETDITNAGTVDISRTESSEIGDVTNSGTIGFKNSGALTVNDVTNSGTMSVTASGATTFNSVSNNGADADNTADVVFNSTGDLTVTNAITNGEYGTMTLGTGADTTTITTVTNSGTLTTAHADVSHQNADTTTGVISET